MVDLFRKFFVVEELKFACVLSERTLTDSSFGLQVLFSKNRDFL